MSVPALRNPDVTRQRILDVAFEEILLKGYQGLRVDQVLKMTMLTKGAFYHHFTSKQALGHAVIDEVLKPWITDKWIAPLQFMQDIPNDLIAFLQQERNELDTQELNTGCPLSNLSQEMSPLDESFRVRIVSIWEAWHQGLANALARGQKNNSVRSDLEPIKVARFLIAAMEGIIGQCKCFKDEATFDEAGECLEQYIKSLSA